MLHYKDLFGQFPFLFFSELCDKWRDLGCWRKLYGQSWKIQTVEEMTVDRRRNQDLHDFEVNKSSKLTRHSFASAALNGKAPSSPEKSKARDEGTVLVTTDAAASNQSLVGTTKL